MEFKSRKLYSTGGALCISLPLVWCDEVGLNKGDWVNVNMDEESRELIISPFDGGKRRKIKNKGLDITLIKDALNHIAESECNEEEFKKIISAIEKIDFKVGEVHKIIFNKKDPYYSAKEVAEIGAEHNRIALEMQSHINALQLKLQKLQKNYIKLKRKKG